MSEMLDLMAEAQRLDEEDGLRGFRERFIIPDNELCYLDGNSLGRPLHDTVR